MAATSTGLRRLKERGRVSYLQVGRGWESGDRVDGGESAARSVGVQEEGEAWLVCRRETVPVPDPQQRAPRTTSLRNLILLPHGFLGPMPRVRIRQV